jgi:antirestriction protein
MKNTFEYGLYIADLAAYNAGHLHGVWVNAEDDVETIESQIQAMLAKSPVDDAEEWAIHDYEGFVGIHLSEYESLNTISAYVCFLNEYPDIGAALLSYFDNDLNEASRAGSERYHGCYDTVGDYAQDILEESHGIPDFIACYVDYDKLGRDMEINGEIFTLEVSDKIYVFCGY